MLLNVVNMRVQRVLINPSMRLFAAAPAAKGAAVPPKAQQGPPEVTITQLRETGFRNLMQTKIIDYAQFSNPELNGVKNKRATFGSFEDEINQHYTLEKTLPADRNSKRVGLLGYKIGMTHFWNKWGQIVPCTVLQIDRCQVTQVKTKEKDGVDAIQIGSGEQRLKHLNKPQAGHYLKYNLPPKRDLAEFQVTPENFLPVGYCLGPRHFRIGQFVDV